MLQLHLQLGALLFTDMIIMIIIPLGGCPKSCSSEKIYYFDCSRGPLLTFMIPLLQVFWQDPQYTLNESQIIAKECQAISRCLGILVKRLHPKTGGFSFLHLFQIIRCFIPSTILPFRELTSPVLWKRIQSFSQAPWEQTDFVDTREDDLRFGGFYGNAYGATLPKVSVEGRGLVPIFGYIHVEKRMSLGR